jgi:hypothetical protein
MPSTIKLPRKGFEQAREAWHFPKVTELRYPDHISTLRDRDDWLKAVCLDQRLSVRAELVLFRLGLYLNIKTGRCDPKIRDLAMTAGLGESDSAERVTRRALKEGEKLGWIKRHERHGGNVAIYSQSNQYMFTIPAEIHRPTGLTSPLATPLATGQKRPSTGHPSPPRTIKDLEHKMSKKEQDSKIGLPRRPTAPGSKQESQAEQWEREGKSPFTGCPIWKRPAMVNGCGGTTTAVSS